MLTNASPVNQQGSADKQVEKGLHVPIEEE
jgi:hypothetical protein